MKYNEALAKFKMHEATFEALKAYIKVAPEFNEIWVWLEKYDWSITMYDNPEKKICNDDDIKNNVKKEKINLQIFFDPTEEAIQKEIETSQRKPGILSPHIDKQNDDTQFNYGNAGGGKQESENYVTSTGDVSNKKGETGEPDGGSVNESMHDTQPGALPPSKQNKTENQTQQIKNESESESDAVSIEDEGIFKF